MVRFPAKIFANNFVEGIDKDLLEKMANFGNGVSEFIDNNEKLELKVFRQMKRALEPCITDIRINWGEGVTQIGQHPQLVTKNGLFSNTCWLNLTKDKIPQR